MPKMETECLRSLHSILGEKTRRDIWVCGPGAFVILKALAFGNIIAAIF